MKTAHELIENLVVFDTLLETMAVVDARYVRVYEQVSAALDAAEEAGLLLYEDD